MTPTPVFDVNLRKVLDDMDRRRRRSRQKLPGPSDIGLCRRRTAYKIVGQPPDNPASKAKAIQGTLLHPPVLAALRAAHGGLSEVRVGRPGVIEGSADLLRHDPLDMAIVGDLKTCGKDTYDDVIRRPLRLEQEFQIMLYADMMRRGEITDKRLPAEPIDVVEIEVYHLCRDDGRSWTRKLPFDQARADEAWAWLEEVHERIELDGIDQVPRDLPGPDVSAVCAGCPFARDCWRWDPATQTRQAVDLSDPAKEEWAVKYDTARTAETAAKKAKALARAHLHGQPAQTWASGWQLDWTGGGTKWIEEPDSDAMATEFVAAGLPVPTRLVETGRAPAIAVRPPKHE